MGNVFGSWGFGRVRMGGDFEFIFDLRVNFFQGIERGWLFEILNENRCLLVFDG